MGCDIHLYVERRVNGVWESADVWTLEPDYPDKLYVTEYDSHYSCRNYHLFGVLANVRRMFDDFEPIADRKGLPFDLSEAVRQLSDAPDWHSHSWLTLRELLDYDWTLSVPCEGYLSALDFARWAWGINDGHFKPAERFISSRDEIRRLSREGKITVSESDDMVDLFTFINPAFPAWRSIGEMVSLITSHYPNHYVLCAWRQPLYTLVGEFWSETIPRLLRLGKPEDVRIVFWFDN